MGALPRCQRKRKFEVTRCCGSAIFLAAAKQAAQAARFLLAAVVGRIALVGGLAAVGLRFRLAFDAGQHALAHLDLHAFGDFDDDFVTFADLGHRADDTATGYDLVATAQTQFQSDQFDVADKAWRKSWNTGVMLQIPIFDGHRSGARVAQAKQILHRAQYDRQRVEREIRLQIQQAFYDVEEAGERIEANRDAVLKAQKGLQIAESRYVSGAGTQLEILDAQLALVQTGTENAMARRDRGLALMRLERSVGILGE